MLHEVVSSLIGGLERAHRCYNILHNVGFSTASPTRLLLDTWRTWREHYDRNKLFSTVINDFPQALEPQDASMRNTLLGVAIAAGDFDAVHFFHKKGGAISYRDETGANYLHVYVAAMNGDFRGEGEPAPHTLLSGPSGSVLQESRATNASYWQWRNLLSYLVMHISLESLESLQSGRPSTLLLASEATGKALIQEGGLVVRFQPPDQLSTVVCTLEGRSWREDLHKDTVPIEQYTRALRIVSNCPSAVKKLEKRQQREFRRAISFYPSSLLRR